MNDSAEAKVGNAGRERGAIIFVLTVVALLAARLCVFIRRYDVNLLASDDWSYLNPMFQGASLWQIYSYRYPLAHEGIGLVIGSFVLKWSHWSTTSLALSLAAVMILACILALVLKCRLFGRLELWDATLPCIFLTFRQYEIFIGSHNPSSQAFPVLTVVVYCLVWLVPHPAWRYVSVLVMNELAIDGGYAYFIGFLTPLLFAVEALRAWRARDRKILTIALALTAVTSVWIALFLAHVRPSSGVIGSRSPWEYLKYVALMFADNVGLRAGHRLTVVVGLALFALTATIFMVTLRAAVDDEMEQKRQLAQVLVVLTGFALLISAATAAGRAWLPLDSAQASRYVPYLMPAFLGIYLCAAALKAGIARNTVLAIILSSTVSSAIWLGKEDRSTVHWLSDRKRTWRACYLQTHDIHGCDAQAQFVLLPNPEAGGMQEKLEFLKRNHLNLYAPE